MKWITVKNLLAKVAAFAITFGGIAAIKGCTALFHENKVPAALLENNRFSSKK
ncbi:hypothetical protein NST62_09855 [Ureibacillus sp. FSL K6-8385]|uniref:hypothetical protein n=1 Tax=Ureibacillus TaxID=160795 RepID=UPI0015EF6BBD|nr:hypothetical protein [Ureibacillus terrenus]MED3662785.1 hypothetical protein [Ureibacillus terrenus]MED3763278.1 hypothetical protein [Ureibacillus terrenus]